MTKLNYPSDGIYKNCKVYSNSCYRYITRAVGYCNLDIPSDFTYYNYLSSLQRTLNTYKKEINSIDNRLQSTSNKFQTLSDDLADKAMNMDFKKIKERDRMII